MKRIDKPAGRFNRNRQIYQGDEGGQFHTRYSNGSYDVHYWPTAEAEWDERIRLGYFFKNPDKAFQVYGVPGSKGGGEFAKREDAMQALYDYWLARKEWLRGPEAAAAHAKLKELTQEYNALNAARKAALEAIRQHEDAAPFELEDIEEDDE